MSKRQRLVVGEDDAPYPSNVEEYRCCFQISLLDDRSAEPPNATEYTSHTQVLMCGARKEGKHIIIHGKRFQTSHPSTRVCLVEKGLGLRLIVVSTNHNTLIHGSILWQCEFDNKSLRKILETWGSKDNNKTGVLTVKGNTICIPCRHDQELEELYPAKLYLKRERGNIYIQGVDVVLDESAFNEYLKCNKY